MLGTIILKVEQFVIQFPLGENELTISSAKNVASAKHRQSYNSGCFTSQNLSKRNLFIKIYTRVNLDYQFLVMLCFY